MERIGTKIINSVILWGFVAVSWAGPGGECRDIPEPTERLACYDSRDKPTTQPLEEDASPKVMDQARNSSEHGSTKSNGESLGQRASSAVQNALKVALPRRNTVEAKAPTKPVEYTISKVLRRYGGKVEYHTADGREFRKLGASASDFAIGDTVVAKLGVFSAVFLINQRGKRIKVKPLN